MLSTDSESLSDQLQLPLGSGWQLQPGPVGGHHVLREDKVVYGCNLQARDTQGWNRNTKSTGIFRASQALELNYMFCL